MQLVAAGWSQRIRPTASCLVGRGVGVAMMFLVALASARTLGQNNPQWGMAAQLDVSHEFSGTAPYALGLGTSLGLEGQYAQGMQALRGEYDLRWQERYQAAWQGELSALGSSAYSLRAGSGFWDARIAHRAQVVSVYEEQWWEDRSPTMVQSVTLSSGLNQRLSRQMGLRVSGQLGANYSALSDVAGYSATSQLTVSRRWTARSSATWALTRQDSLAPNGHLQSTLYRADWQHSYITRHGHWGLQVGVSRIDLGDRHENVLTGGLEGSQRWSGGETSWQLERTVSSSLLQFQLAERAPEQAQALAALGVDASTVLLSAPGLTVLDRVQLGQQIATPCAYCTWDFALSAVHQQPQSEDPAQHQYAAQTRLGVAVNARQQWQTGYRVSVQGPVQDGWPKDHTLGWDMSWSQRWAPATRSQLTATYQRQSVVPERWQLGVQLSLSQRVF